MLQMLSRPLGGSTVRWRRGGEEEGERKRGGGGGGGGHGPAGHVCSTGGVCTGHHPGGAQGDRVYLGVGVRRGIGGGSWEELDDLEQMLKSMNRRMPTLLVE